MNTLFRSASRSSWRMLVLVFVAAGALVGAQAPDESTSGQDWPLQIQSGDTKIVLYQPQPESFVKDKLTARAAVSVQRKGDAEPTFGAVWIEARVSTDRDARLVTVLDIQVPEVKFPNATPEMKANLVQVLRTELPKEHPTCSLDRLMTSLDQANGVGTAATGLQNTPPRILFAKVPTVLVTIDGQPELQAVEGSRVMRVANTPFVILFDGATKTYYLRAGERWGSASDITGPWTRAPAPPPEIVAAVPPTKVDGTVATAPPDTAGAEGAAPVQADARIVVALEPTELIVSEGEPKWTPLPGNDLLYLANSENDVFLDVAAQRHYVLLAGRWFTSASLEHGPWTYVAADALPAAFSRIPADSPKADVRAFVGGTEEAREAVLDATIPQTSVIKRADATCATTYDGEPVFAPVDGTSLKYAVNTSSSVVQSDNRYYCCSGGVWFVANDALGPWAACTSVPAEIYSIPASCPIYPVRYVYVYDATDDYLTVGYLPGYTGCYVAGPTIVYGTGWRYRGWWGRAYYPRPATWGFCAQYDPWTCGWSFGLDYGWGVGPSWFALSFGWGHPGWWGPGGFHGRRFDIQDRYVRAHEPYAALPGRHAFAAFEGRDNVYRRPENRGRNVPVPARGLAEARVRAAGRIPNDVYADRDGNVLRHSERGWEERRADGWKPTERVGSPARSNPLTPGNARPAPGSERSDPGFERPVPREPGGDRREPGAGRPVPPPESAPGRPAAPPRQDFDRLQRARERGDARASGPRAPRRRRG